MFGGALLALALGYHVAFTLAGVGIVFAGLGLWLDLGLFAGGDAAILGSVFDRIFGLMDTSTEILIAVPLFVFMGVMLERSAVAADMLETMGALFGAVRGGLGFSVVLVGMLLAASTGIVGATVVTMGLISLPVMLRHGYAKSLACGSIAASGTLGQIIPPSIVLVILGDTLSNEYMQARRDAGDWAPDPVSVGDLFAGALLPGLLLVLVYLAFQAGLATFAPRTSPSIAGAHAARPSPAALARVLLPPLALIVAVLGSILVGAATPTEAAAVGAVGALLLAGARLGDGRPIAELAATAGMVAILPLRVLFDLRINRDAIAGYDQAGIALAAGACALVVWGLARSLVTTFRGRGENDERVLFEVCAQTLRMSCMVFAIFIGAQIFNTTFRGLGGDESVAALLHGLPGGPWAVMAAVMLTMFLLGFFLDFLEIVFVVVPVVAPVLFAFNGAGGEALFHPVWVAVMIAVNLQTSFLTPPFGFALFYLRGVAPASVSTLDIYRGVTPYVAIQVAVLLVVAAWPALATWLPGVVFGQPLATG